MADPTPYPDTREDARTGSDDGAPPTGMPRWVKVSLIIVAALVLAFVILRLTGVGGEHGPGRHMGPGGAGGPTSSSNVTEHRPPAGVPNHGR